MSCILKKGMAMILIFCLCTGFLSGCAAEDKDVKIGVSFGVGKAQRWVNEKKYMEDKAAELGIELEARLNITDEPKTQQEDCFEMIDGGIDVLILIPRDINNTKEIIDYARKNNVKVISYARIVWEQPIDLFVGYDSIRIGQKMGQFLSESVFEGDYIILRGDAGDFNASLLYDGAMRYINDLKPSINILVDEEVPGWSPDEAKKIVMKAVKENQNKVDAILAPNDKLAGACAEALEELGVETPVVITGMDTEPEALQRIINGKQSCTIYMDLKILSETAVLEAYHMAMGEKVTVNADFDNGMESPIPANLITGQVITKENLDRILIDSGVMTREEIYGSN